MHSLIEEFSKKSFECGDQITLLRLGTDLSIKEINLDFVSGSFCPDRGKL
jgi:hypothetical protein